MRQISVWLFISTVVFLPYNYASIFSTPLELENLLTNDVAPAIVDEYINSEMKRLRWIKKLSDDYASRNRQTRVEASMNPVDAYLLVKRLTSDWKNIVELMKTNDAENFVYNITQSRAAHNIKYPNEEDIENAALVILNVQETYRLNISDLADGIIQGEQIGGRLTGRDYYEVGITAYTKKDYYSALMWMEEALQRIKKEYHPTVRIGDVLEYLALVLYRQGNAKRAIATAMRIIKEDPTHDRANSSVDVFRNVLDEEEKENLDELPPLQNERSTSLDVSDGDLYGRLCRGEFSIEPSMRRRMYCYLKRDRPFLKLAPIKTEIVHLKPLVVLFRDVISDNEIVVIKRLATPKLAVSGVINITTGETTYTAHRKSETGWLKDKEHEVVSRISQRVDLMTNLDQSNTEELQVGSYGIGGYYYSHYDTSPLFESQPGGNRIATVLFYMSQPKMGGATVYTELATGVQPSIHDALFWYNLKRNGENDSRMRHAACPVLSGVKWVGNKWIHERGQEFRRPCGLSPDAEERFVGDLTPQ